MKSCPICGDEPIVRGKHDLYCTPALRRLVRETLWHADAYPHAKSCICRYCRAVAAWRKEREK